MAISSDGFELRFESGYGFNVWSKMNLGQLTQRNENDSLEGPPCSVQSGVEFGTILTSNCDVWKHVKLNGW